MKYSYPPASFPSSSCTFEQPEVCGDALLETLACPSYEDGEIYGYTRTAITSGELLSRGSGWILADHTYGTHLGKFMLV